MRKLIAFTCEGETLLGTLDHGAGATGLLIVQGGSEIRAGAHRGMAWLAQTLAEHGVAVFRFDRRGIGDSTGDNGGYASSGPDIAAAAMALRAQVPHLRKLVALGTCDGATALVLHAKAADLDCLILGNPWVSQTSDGLPPAGAIEERYKQRLRDPAEWLRLLRGGVNIRQLIRGLKRIAANRLKPTGTLADQFFVSLTGTETIILAKRDATAVDFVSEARRRSWKGKIYEIDTASHSFARDGDGAALVEALCEALALTAAPKT